ncbi:MAG: valine--tRNA ligase [Fibrobacteres bacterium]|nr:valine--tRNA ligase [Fibrobacterota bacterium]
MELEKVYNPASVEGKWYKVWEESGYFKADEKKEGPRYCVMIPPPNVTGHLHLGHVLNNTLQDILVRKKRMEGFNVLWMPGTDHAGIATQNVVEKALLKEEKKTRHDLGREAFVARVWEWKAKYGSTIIKQLKRLGSSCDWSRERFTMDEGLSNAVKESFVRLYDKGLIYQGQYIVNWCPRCRTALSDEENIHKDKQGKLWHFRYPLADGSGELVVATTRPETMLGDTAVAVNPSDERYKSLVGKMIRLPLADRDIPIITDDLVDKEFGTGCVKVTPAHDPNDFKMGERSKLPRITVMNEDGTMNNVVPEKYRNLDRFACRKAVVADMEALGLLVKIEEHAHAVGHCERCDTVTEPYLSKQWFVKYDAWVGPAVDAVKKKELRFYPEKWEKTFLHWMENIRDWCISRQLWWGHRIPVWYCGCGEVMVAREAPDKCRRCGGTNLQQDNDVLDTWFSSWLWPFSTLGWPQNTELLKKFYPTDALVTAADIIFFWVARMVFAGQEFMGQLPFKDVYFNSVVRDPQGRKMSKSLGNSPDPIDVMDKYGADALRYTIVHLAPTGQDVLFGEEKCELGRNFANKLWNTARFIFMNTEGFKFNASQQMSAAVEDRWIISEFNEAVKKVSGHIDGYNFNAALDEAYHFTWNSLCDWYVELIKPRLAPDADPVSKAAALNTIVKVFNGTLTLLHPFMPFITEELYAALKENGLTEKTSGHLMMEKWPTFNEAEVSLDAERQIAFAQAVITAVRTMRAEKNIPPSKKGEVQVICGDETKAKWLKEVNSQVCALSKTGTLDIKVSGDPLANSVSAVTEGVTVFLSLEGLVDKAAEADKIRKEIERVQGFAASLEAKLSNEKFVSNAPAAVLDKERAKLNDSKEKIIKLNETLKLFI